MTRVGEAAPVGEDVQAHLVEFGAAVGVQGAALFVRVLGGLLGGELLVVVSAGGEAGGLAAHGAVELGGVTGEADVGETGADGFLSADGQALAGECVGVAVADAAGQDVGPVFGSV